MQHDILEKVAEDLLFIPFLISRGVRRRLFRSTLDGFELDITPLHCEVMGLIENEGPLHAAEIGERLEIARAQMTQLIDKLADLKLVQRKTDESDRRIINIILTDMGKTVIEEHKERVINAIREHMSSLNKEDLEDLGNSLRKIRDILLKLQ